MTITSSASAPRQPSRAAVRGAWALQPAFCAVPGVDLGLDDPERVPVPFPVFLIHHDQGLVLFDAGLDPRAAGDPAAVYGDLATAIDMKFAPDLVLGRQLRDLGFDTGDVHTIVASHLHFDHCGGIREFPHARAMVGEGELRYAHFPDGHTAGSFRPSDFDKTSGIQWTEVCTDQLDLFDDGSVVLHVLPGHSPGSMAMQVQLPERSLVLSGDVVHSRSAYERALPYPYDSDSATAIRSIKRLRNIVEAASADLWIHHDPADWERHGGAGAIS